MARMRAILRLGARTAFLAALASCSTPPAAHVARDARPTLEEIFGDPPIDGVRPSDLAISADGSHVSYRWWAREAHPDDSGADAPAAGPKAPIWVVPSRGGEAVSIGEASVASWRASGAELVVLREKS